MFELDQKAGPTPKCYFTQSVLPAYVDHEQISTKKRPFCTTSEHHAIHTVSKIHQRVYKY